jgi:thiol-disulfide isomerase/thioredoxin
MADASSSSSSSSSKTVISAFENRHVFMSFLESNPGLIVVKFGATWCAPCKRIKPVVDAFFGTSPDNVVCCDIDVDESDDLFSFFKAKKMVNQIPAMLCFAKGNHSFIPNDSVTGTAPEALDAFFRRCGKILQTV